MKRREPLSIARLLVLLLLVVVTVSLMGTVALAQETDIRAEKECYLAGDMNADGSFGTEDAIYTLYHTLFEDAYPIRQNVDVNGDDSIDTMDAIELLYATLFDYLPEYEKYGELTHDYYDPIWNWAETDGGVSATVTLQCACGEKSHTLDAEVTLGEEVAAGCTAAGYQMYTAQVSDSDETFTATYKKTLPAVGHVEGEKSFDEDQHYTNCANCGAAISAESHNWEEDGAPVEGDCQIPTVQNYKCSCGAVKSEQLGTLEHAWEDKGDVLVDGCQYAKKHVCDNCGSVALTDHYENHEYVASIEEATCQKNGQKIYKCSKCGTVDDSRTEIIASGDDKHVWDNGVEDKVNGVMIYTCQFCGLTKTAVIAKEDGTISGDALQNADELEVGDATLSMEDSVKDELGGNDVQITVEPLKPEQLADILKEEELAQIGENTVYDFNMNVGGQEVNKFDGKITISLPYTLEEGEDIDGIDVWYINAEGELTQQEATYSNGYVTFTTDHFSYYTVTRLTPEQRCARYGHIWTDASKLPTCTADGYTKQVCQRCAKEEVLEEHKAFGHDYNTTVTDPTCDKFGSKVTTCENCGHTTSSVIPALGHKMTLSETVEATCDAAGKYVFICANGCGHEAEQEIPQLTHDYRYSDTVNATCTTGGYDIFVCAYCKDEIKKNETLPTGHNFSDEDAKWTWNKNKTSATLTLCCTNDNCGGTKELKATVTTVEASCLNDGMVLATVFYNNKTYAAEETGNAAMGHKPGAEWITNEKQHYFECEACGEKIEAATHDFDDGVVTKEPTCIEDGKIVYTCSVCGYSREEVVSATGKHSYGEGVVTKEPTCGTKGTKVYTCSVCGKTREETIAATGDHDYVDGKCSVCGKVQSDCNHMNRTEKLIDVSGYGICEGFEIVEISCECGEFRIFEINNATCDLEEVFTEQDESSITEARQCTNCGLYAVLSQEIRFSTDPCMAELVYAAELNIDGVFVAGFETVLESVEHYAHILVESVKLSDDTMCDLYMYTHRCGCGEVTVTGVDSSCEWNYTGYGDNAVCRTCGAKRERIQHAAVTDGCMITDSWSYIYQNKAGEEVYTHLEENSYFEHENELTDYELYGESCEDGVWAEYTCSNCGEVREDYYTYHEMILSTVTDLSDAAICMDALLQRSCICGLHKQQQPIYGDKECEWISWAGDWETNTYIDKCMTCGAEKWYVGETSEKDENCQFVIRETYTYKDAEGNVLAIGENLDTRTEHNIQREFQLNGDSCEDGVTIIEYCTDCDLYDKWTTDGHIEMETVYDLSQYGFCGGRVYVRGCPCGEINYVDVEAWGCDWTGAGDEGWWYRECLTCGGVWDTHYSYEQVDDCHGQTVYNYSFRKNGEEFLNIDFVERSDTHRWVSEFIFDGETCEDGYTLISTCLTCGETEEFGGIGCELYPVSREMFTDIGLCGDVDLITLSCACGANTQTRVEWRNGACEFQYAGHGEEDDSYIYKCYACGAIRYERNYHEQVPGMPECYRQHRWEYTYYLNDVELFTETGTDKYTEHKWDHEFELIGETCEDGVWVIPTCALCGETGGQSMVYHHETYRKYYDLSEFGFCGGEVEFYSCPCGQESDADVRPFGCGWQTEVDSEGYVKNICPDCGGIWEVSYSEVVLNACISYTEFHHVFTKADGTVALDLTWVDRSVNHEWKTTFEMEGESCEDGVTITEICERCGESSSYYTRNHDRMTLEYYDLADYGMCNGYLRIYGCACGEFRDAEWYSHCTWYGMGGYGDVDGFTEHCENCDMVWSWKWKTVEQINSCIARVENTIVFSKGENVITESWIRTKETHSEVYELTLWEGSASCEDGYDVRGYCQDCGETLRSYGSSGIHELYVTAVQLVELDAKTCGGIYYNTLSCACGERTGGNYTFENCQFEYRYDEEMGREVYRCIYCGLTRITDRKSVPIEGETCRFEEITTYTYLLNGEAIISCSESYESESHCTIAVHTMLGETCDDGYYCTWVCQYCGEEMGYSDIIYGCDSTQRVRREKLADKGVLCGDLYADIYSCACGKNTHSEIRWENGSCDFDEYWDEELGEWVYTCVNCGVQRYYTSTKEPIEGETCKYLWTENHTYVRDGEELFTYVRTYVSTSHNTVAQLILQVEGGTCDDGYMVNWVCKDCGIVTSEGWEVYYGCSTYVIQKTLLAKKGDLCGDLYVYDYSCACGKETHSHRNWSDGYCDFYHVDYIEEEECYLYECQKCGAYRKEYNEHTKVEGSECTEIHNWDYVYYNVNGDYLFTDSGSNSNHSGRWVYTYYLLGETCDDGYMWSRTCTFCGMTEEGNDPWYGCSSNRVECIPIVENSDAVCGMVTFNYYSCACGKNNWWSIDHNCRFDWVEWDGEAEADIYRCTDCGLYYRCKTPTVREPNSCLYTRTLEYTYWIVDGEEIIELGSLNKILTRREHQIVYDMTLAEGATSCEDGYYMTARCIYCDYRSEDFEIQYGHSCQVTTHYELSDYGMCGGYIFGYSCACGKEQSWSYNHYSCSYSYTGNRNEYGADEYYCESCNTYFYMYNGGEYVPEECVNKQVMYARLVRDGEVLLEIDQPYEQESHLMLAVGFDGTCGDYVTVYNQCFYCGVQDTDQGGTNHSNQFLVDYLNLDMIGACGGYAEQYRCVCGDRQDVRWNTNCSWTWSDRITEEIDGVVYYTETRTCNNCGLSVVQTYHDSEKDENCTYIRTYTYEFRMNGELLKIMTDTNSYTEHEYHLTNRELLGESCEDGVRLTYSCVCGASYTNHHYGHYTYADESRDIDLGEYGAVCGSELQYFTCTCGEYQGYEFNGLCDWNSRFANMWIEDALSVWQPSTESWISFNSQAYTYTCAVTDPQCGLKVRMAYIWLKDDNCTAVQYEVWQLGYREIYDETTGETTYVWDKEIMIPTGRTSVYHDYAYSYVDGREEGNGTTTESYICKDCNSSYITVTEHADYSSIRSETIAINTLDNGMNKEYRTLRACDFQLNGSYYETLSRSSWIYADGREYWYEYETTYTSEEGCKYMQVYRDCNGSESIQFEGEHYITSDQWEYEKYPTCSQPGIEVCTSTCQLCQEIVSVESYSVNPTRHNWWWNYEKDIYYCSDCGLENCNGADGTIVLEDMTEDYGNATDYVVGYWNRGYGEFIVYASVVLNDMEDADELVLTDISFNYLTVENDGINAVSVSQAVIAEAAAAAIADAGYNGSYAIRIAFVSTDDGGTLDYAITFDSVMA